MFKNQTDIVGQIHSLCASIRNETMFAEHNHLLTAALSALQSARVVLGSMNVKDHAAEEHWVSNKALRSLDQQEKDSDSD